MYLYHLISGIVYLRMTCKILYHYHIKPTTFNILEDMTCMWYLLYKIYAFELKGWDVKFTGSHLCEKICDVKLKGWYVKLKV